MYKGVIRDEARVKKKEAMKEREDELLKSLKRRELYESVQSVPHVSPPTT